jgi:hypothetical protein
MKAIHILLFTLCCQASYSVFGQTTKPAILISNPSHMARNAAVVAIPWSLVIAKYPNLDTANFQVILSATKKELPWQLEHRGEKTIQNLLVQVDVPAKKTLQLIVQKGKPLAITPKTFGRYVPERKDDFAWENDKIAFRMYGKALEGTTENAYGMDVWVKRTDKLVLNERYQRGNYHIDNGDGMDYYHVGFSLGAGNMMPYVNDSIYYSQNYHRWRVLDNGPLRTTFRLEYDSWSVNGLPVTASKTISLDAGSQLSRVEVSYQYATPSPLPVVVGIIKRKEPGALLLDEQQGILAYWEPEHGVDGITGVGSILLTPITQMTVNTRQSLAQTVAQKDTPIVYYTGAAWNKANVITTSAAWFAYLQNYRAKLMQPLLVE